MKIANMLSIALMAGTAAAGAVLVTSSEATAIPANGAAIARIGQQVDSVINARRRCPADQRRDRYGYCRPSSRL